MVSQILPFKLEALKKKRKGGVGKEKRRRKEETKKKIGRRGEDSLHLL